jgi:hypothetical protein
LPYTRTSLRNFFRSRKNHGGYSWPSPVGNETNCRASLDQKKASSNSSAAKCSRAACSEFARTRLISSSCSVDRAIDLRVSVINLDISAWRTVPRLPAKASAVLVLDRRSNAWVIRALPFGHRRGAKATGPPSKPLPLISVRYA